MNNDLVGNETDWLDSSDVSEALGFMNFQTGPLAHLYQEIGCGPAKKAEAEQAFMFLKFLKLVRLHGSEWKFQFDKELAGVIEQVKALREAKKAGMPSAS